jgi:hypothetical protein
MLWMRVSVILKSSAGGHNGAICTRQLDELTYEFSKFANISHCTDEVESAAVLLGYENAYDSAVLNCTFIGSDPNATSTIKILDGHPLLLSGCSFSGKVERELGSELVKPIDCRFGHVVLSRALTGYRPLGFNTKLTPPTITAQAIISPRPVQRPRTRTTVGMVVCVVVSLITAALLALLLLSLGGALHGIGKTAREIL